MFKSYQILTPSKLVKNFGVILKELNLRPQALLITPRQGDKLVLVNADIFEDLLDFRFRSKAVSLDDNLPAEH